MWQFDALKNIENFLQIRKLSTSRILLLAEDNMATAYFLPVTYKSRMGGGWDIYFNIRIV